MDNRLIESLVAIRRPLSFEVWPQLLYIDNVYYFFHSNEIEDEAIYRILKQLQYPLSENWMSSPKKHGSVCVRSLSRNHVFHAFFSNDIRPLDNSEENLQKNFNLLDFQLLSVFSPKKDAVVLIFPNKVLRFWMVE